LLNFLYFFKVVTVFFVVFILGIELFFSTITVFVSIISEGLLTATALLSSPKLSTTSILYENRVDTKIKLYLYSTQRNLMQDKKTLINEIKELWKSEKIEDFDISPELLKYLELKDLEELKAKILNSKTNLTQEQKDWLFQFRKY